MRPARRRGAMYVAVLTTTMLVVVLGLTGLTATRIRFQTQNRIDDAVAAGFLAQAALEHAIQVLADDPDWPANVTHDAWVAAQTLGEGTIDWKVADPVHGDFRDPAGPIYLTGRGQIGDAVRLLCVRVRMPTASKNALENPDFENGVTGWAPLSAYGDCDVKRDHDAHEGDSAGAVTKRSGTTAGLAQAVTVELGKRYDLSAWINGDSGHTQHVALVFDTDDGYQVAEVTATQLASAYQNITGQVTANWTGKLNAAYFFVYLGGTDSDFLVDNVSLTEASRGHVEIVAGTFRRQMN